MIIQFYDRKEELNLLKKYLERPGFDLIIIYGRRRIGKTALILEATKNMNKIYYMATEKNNLKSFYEKCSKIFPKVQKLKKDWELIFEFLKEKRKINIVIIDEFQNLIKEDKTILSIFQRIIDTILSNSDIKLVLLGSTVSIITSKVLSYKSPLYGRKSISMKLKPMKFFDIYYFFPNKNINELIEIYGFADGIPHYLNKIDRNINFWSWLQKELQEKTFILDEVDFLMRYEFEELGTYKAILQAIAFGKTKINEIKEFTGLKRTDISPYIKNLIETDFIYKEQSIFEKPKSRKTRYYIKDNFLTFWFRFIYPNLSSIEEGIFDIEMIKQEYNTYLGKIFEKICKQWIVELIKNKKIPYFYKIGKHWINIPEERKTYEIDIVALNEVKKEMLLCECKYKDNVNAEKIANELYKKLEYIDWNKDSRNVYFTIFAKSFKEKIQEFENHKVYCFDLKDLENFIKSNSNQ